MVDFVEELVVYSEELVEGEHGYMWGLVGSVQLVLCRSVNHPDELGWPSADRTLWPLTELNPVSFGRAILDLGRQDYLVKSDRAVDPLHANLRRADPQCCYPRYC